MWLSYILSGVPEIDTGGQRFMSCQKASVSFRFILEIGCGKTL